MSCASPPSLLTHALCTHAVRQTRPRTKTEHRDIQWSTFHMHKQGSLSCTLKSHSTRTERHAWVMLCPSTWSAERTYEKQERREGRTEQKKTTTPNNFEFMARFGKNGKQVTKIRITCKGRKIIPEKSLTGNGTSTHYLKSRKNPQ